MKSLKDNVQYAVTNFMLWLSWYPNDFGRAVQFAGDCLDTEEEIDRFTKEIEKLRGTKNV